MPHKPRRIRLLLCLRRPRSTANTDRLANFAIGGRDVFRCGAKSDPKYHGETRYLHIVPESHIVSSETIDADGKRLSASLTTVQLMPKGTQTKLTLTVQVAAFEGRDMIEGTRFGHNAALANLAKALSGAA